jgi:hypothetical protein
LRKDRETLRKPDGSLILLFNLRGMSLLGLFASLMITFDGSCNLKKTGHFVAFFFYFSENMEASFRFSSK